MKFFKKYKKIILVFITFMLFLFFIFLLYCFWPIVFYDSKNKPERIFIVDKNNNIITDKPNKFWYHKPWKINLNSKFVKSLIKIEDKNFYNNYWVDILAKARAFKNNIFYSKIVSGASTITEQYIKNKYFSKNSRTYLQKSREAFLAFCFSLFKEKDEILESYLDNLYFWNNIYGVNSASFVYFWKNDLKDLSDEEIVLLISLLHYPSTKSLYNKKFRAYFEKVKKRLGFSFKRKIKKLNKHNNIDKYPFVTNNFPKNEGKSSIDSKLQDFSLKVLNKTLDELKEKNVTNWAIIALDPKTMEVLIYIWSRDFYSKKIDWQVDVIKSIRQVWSTFKPFLYLQALEKWASSNSLLIDIESEYDSFQRGKSYISENYSLKEYGLVSFQKSLWNSLNNATVRLAKELWLKEVFEFYKSFWFKFLKNNPKYYWYSFVLWNPSLTLENLVLAYVNLLPNYKIKKDRKLSFLYEEDEEKLQKRLKDNLISVNKNKFLLYNILKNPDNRDISFWVNSILNTSIFQAVKTGTSSNFKDNLVVSYHPDFVLWVWVWNNDNSSMVWVTWISWAGYIWHQIIEKAIKLGYIKEDNYKIPDGVSKKDYCFDKDCFMKKIDFDKSDKIYFSRISDDFYSKKDLFEKLDAYEESRLKDLGFEVR